MCLGGGAGAQQIVRVDVDTVACLHDTVRIAVGHTAAADVEVRDMLLNLSHAERAFLPDGVSCPPYGCSYRSHVTFSGLDNSVQIRTVEDIKYVRLNIEHSFIGELERQRQQQLRRRGAGRQPHMGCGQQRVRQHLPRCGLRLY